MKAEYKGASGQAFKGWETPSGSIHSRYRHEARMPAMQKKLKTFGAGVAFHGPNAINKKKDLKQLWIVGGGRI